MGGGGNEDGDADWRAGRVNAAAAAGSQLCRKQPTAQTVEKYAELTSIRFKYCIGSTRFKGHLGIDVGWGTVEGAASREDFVETWLKVNIFPPFILRVAFHLDTTFIFFFSENK